MGGWVGLAGGQTGVRALAVRGPVGDAGAVAFSRGEAERSCCYELTFFVATSLFDSLYEILPDLLPSRQRHRAEAAHAWCCPRPPCRHHGFGLLSARLLGHSSGFQAHHHLYGRRRAQTQVQTSESHSVHRGCWRPYGRLRNWCRQMGSLARGSRPARSVPA